MNEYKVKVSELPGALDKIPGIPEIFKESLMKALEGRNDLREYLVIKITPQGIGVVDAKANPETTEFNTTILL